MNKIKEVMSNIIFAELLGKCIYEFQIWQTDAPVYSVECRGVLVFKAKSKFEIIFYFKPHMTNKKYILGSDSFIRWLVAPC